VLTPNERWIGIGSALAATGEDHPDGGAAAAADEANTGERRAERRPIVAFVWYQIIGSQGPRDAAGYSGIARSCDISKGGLGIFTSRPLPAGTLAFVEIATADGNVSAVGKIVHSVEVREGYHRSGVQLEIVPPNDRALLARLLK